LWQLTQDTPSEASTPAPSEAGSTVASGAWQTTHLGLDAGSGIDSASAILAEREVVSAEKVREWTSRCDHVTNWLLFSPAPPWHPLVEQLLAPSGSAPLAATETSAAAKKNWRITDCFAGRMIIGLARLWKVVYQWSVLGFDSSVKCCEWKPHAPS
jgi:hypothetical protein